VLTPAHDRACFVEYDMNKSISIFEASTLNTIAQTPRDHADVRQRLVERLDAASKAREVGDALLKTRAQRDAADDADQMATKLEAWVGAEEEDSVLTEG